MAVTVYGSPGCWKCVDVEERLDRLGVEYESVTVRGNPDARAAMVRAMGEPPLIPMIIDGELAVWDRRRIMSYLDETYGEGGAASYTEMPSYMGGFCTLDGDCITRWARWSA